MHQPRPQGSILPGSRKHRILELLRLYPRGQFARNMAGALDIAPTCVTSLCCQMHAAGLLGSLTEPAGKGQRRIRWHLAEHAEVAAKASAESLAAAAEVKRIDAAAKVKRKAPAGVAPVVVPHRLPAPVAVVPFFSAMTPGSYLTTGSAIERAYGGGK